MRSASSAALRPRAPAASSMVSHSSRSGMRSSADLSGTDRPPRCDGYLDCSCDLTGQREAMVQTDFGGTDECGRMLNGACGNSMNSRFAELPVVGHGAAFRFSGEFRMG